MDDELEVLVAGGGIAGLETVLALHALAPGRARLRLMAPEPEFEMKPLSVEEPFTHAPAERHDLRALMAELGGEFVEGAIAEVDPEAHSVRFGYSDSRSYDVLVVCTGAKSRPVFSGVETFWSNRTDVRIDALIGDAHASPARSLALVVPPGLTWSLPLYELALLIRRRSEELGLADLEIEVFTPEGAPLGLFGDDAGAAIAELLEVRRISVVLETLVSQPDGQGPLAVSGQSRTLDPRFVLALPQLRGAFLPGLPADRSGFIPVDRLGRVAGIEDVYAAGDGTSFPIKQGGLATQQADAVAEHIAMRLGVLDSAKPFEPVLRGQLLIGAESLNLRHDLGAGKDAGEVSSDYLWWPPQKVAGRYLAAWLGHAETATLATAETATLATPDRAVEIEVGWPHEWHSQPL